VGWHEDTTLSHKCDLGLDELFSLDDFVLKTFVKLVEAGCRFDVTKVYAYPGDGLLLVLLILLLLLLLRSCVA
jgi:hypothetical protein